MPAHLPAAMPHVKMQATMGPAFLDAQVLRDETSSSRLDASLLITPGLEVDATPPVSAQTQRPRSCVVPGAGLATQLWIELGVCTGDVGEESDRRKLVWRRGADTLMRATA